MTSVPNELKITINTNIPGFQTIKYKPYMTLPNDRSDGSVQFNPLVKLKQSVIKSLPPNIQVSEFFNKGLFQSLINSHGLVRAKSLLEATNEGYVDNNINVTLDTLFPSNSVIYINKQPYAIADVQWTKGDWKIDKKIQEMPQLDSTRIRDPYLYQTVVKDEIISGENELNQIPNDIIYGPNYTGPTNVASGVKKQDNPENPENPENQKTYLPLEPSTLPLPPAEPAQSINKPNKPTPKYLPLPPAEPAQPINRPNKPNKPNKPTPEYIPLPPAEQAQPINKPIKPERQYPALLPPAETDKSSTIIPPKKHAKILQIADAQYNDDKEIEPIDEIKLTASRKSSASLRGYFKDKDYYFMLNTIFKNMNEEEKSVVDKIFKETSGVDVKPSNNLSTKAYNITTDNIRVNENTGAGDCFFIAVADAINFYNSNVNSNADKIIYNNYGKEGMIYTQKMLRELISYYILHMNSINFSELSSVLEYNVSRLNDKFTEQYNAYKKNIFHNKSITPNIFFDIVNNIYHSDENFLIMKPTKMTEETIRKPFRPVNKSEIKDYIESSDYWANNVAIDALCEILGLNIIVLESRENKVRIPYIYNNIKPWSKYMFLYHENNHYELISFDYIFKTFRKEPAFSIKTQKVRIVIFEKIGKIYPPLSIIFLIFATNYINIKEINDKNNYQLLGFLLKSILGVFNKIETTQTKNDNKKFLDLFNKYFQSPFLVHDKQIEIIKDIQNPIFEKKIEGGRLFPYEYRQNNEVNQYDNNKTNISYYVTISMDLKKGTALSKKDISDLKCNHRWNSIRKNYSDLRGLAYTIIPDYTNLPDSNNKSKTQKGGLYLKTTNNKTKKRKVFI
jgi:hypothetical protein